MSQPIDNLLGMHTGALALWQKRTEVLASNLANTDTPGYLARDVDFRKALAAASGNGDGSLPLNTPTAGQINTASQASDTLAYRVPTQPSMDGNTVDAQQEQAAFAANGVHYQASLAFITAQIRMMRTAITGGQG
jgi:flagellar basal-body rod protein FlgB